MKLALAMLAAVGAAPAAATNPAPAGRVEARAIAHPGPPALRVRVTEAATYAGGERFTLYEVADAEVHVFVEADAGRRIRRFYWIQWESYLPGRPDARYDYGESDRRMDLWGAPAWVRAGPTRTDRPARAGSDSERVRTILTRAGYTAPPQVMTVRLVRLLDDPKASGYGRRELMLIYGEDLAPTGATLDQVTTDGKPNARWNALEPPLIERAAAAFSVEPDEAGD